MLPVAWSVPVAEPVPQRDATYITLVAAPGQVMGLRAGYLGHAAGDQRFVERQSPILEKTQPVRTGPAAFLCS